MLMVFGLNKVMTAPINGCDDKCGTLTWHSTGICLSSGRCRCWWGWTGPNAVKIDSGEFKNQVLADHCTMPLNESSSTSDNITPTTKATALVSEVDTSNTVTAAPTALNNVSTDGTSIEVSTPSSDLSTSLFTADLSTDQTTPLINGFNFSPSDAPTNQEIGKESSLQDFSSTELAATSITVINELSTEPNGPNNLVIVGDSTLTPEQDTEPLITVGSNNANDSPSTSGTISSENNATFEFTTFFEGLNTDTTPPFETSIAEDTATLSNDITNTEATETDEVFDEIIEPN